MLKSLSIRDKFILLIAALLFSAFAVLYFMPVKLLAGAYIRSAGGDFQSIKGNGFSLNISKLSYGEFNFENVDIKNRLTSFVFHYGSEGKGSIDLNRKLIIDLNKFDLGKIQKKSKVNGKIDGAILFDLKLNNLESCDIKVNIADLQQFGLKDIQVVIKKKQNESVFRADVAGSGIKGEFNGAVGSDMVLDGVFNGTFNGIPLNGQKIRFNLKEI